MMLKSQLVEPQKGKLHPRGQTRENVGEPDREDRMSREEEKEGSLSVRERERVVQKRNVNIFFLLDKLQCNLYYVGLDTKKKLKHRTVMF